ncbi:MAG: hypothetical protein ABEK17_01510, partial [Candidatus Aenigmatarchaeota archaeon]
MKDLNAYIINTDNKNKIFPTKISTDVYEGLEYYIIHFDVPKSGNEMFNVHISGKVEELGRKNILLSHVVLRNHYLFGTN